MDGTFWHVKYMGFICTLCPLIPKMEDFWKRVYIETLPNFEEGPLNSHVMSVIVMSPSKRIEGHGKIDFVCGMMHCQANSS